MTRGGAYQFVRISNAQGQRSHEGDAIRPPIRSIAVGKDGGWCSRAPAPALAQINLLQSELQSSASCSRRLGRSGGTLRFKEEAKTSGVLDLWNSNLSRCRNTPVTGEMDRECV